MSAAARDWAWGAKGLSPAAHLVLLKLADWSDEERGQCYRSENQLAGDCDLTRRTVQRALTALLERGLIAVAVAATRKSCTHYALACCWRHSDARASDILAPPIEAEEPEENRTVVRFARHPEPPARNLHSSCPGQSAAKTPSPETTMASPSPDTPTPSADDAAAWDSILPRASINAWGLAAKPFYRQACEALRTHGMVERFNVLYAEEANTGRRRRGGVFFERLPELAQRAADEYSAQHWTDTMPLAGDVLKRDEARDAQRAAERHARYLASLADEEREAVVHA